MTEKPSDTEHAVDENEQDTSHALEEEGGQTVEEAEKEEVEQEEEQEEVEEQPPVEEVGSEKLEEKEGAEEKEEEAEAEEEEEAGEEEEIEIVEERVYTVPFRKAWITPRGKRTPRALRMLRDFARHHMKSEDIEISNEVNEELWARGIKKPPRQIKVRLVKDKEGRVIVYPATAA